MAYVKREFRCNVGEPWNKGKRFQIIPRVEPRPDRLKQCRGQCKQWLPIEFFSRDRQRPDGRRNECRVCRKESRSMKIDQPTPGQLRVLVFVAAHIDTVGLPPRRDEIANHFGTKHRQQVHCQLYQLELRGLLVRATMQVTDKGRIAITEGSSVDRTEQRRIHQRERNRRRVAAEQSLRGFKNALREALQLDPLPEWDS